MDIEIVRQKESTNDGQTIHLFYDEVVGMYLAFGLSAYYSTMVVEPCMSFSNALEMPVALLNRIQIKFLRQSLTKMEHLQKSYYRFRLRTRIGEAGYKRWMKETFGDKG